MQQVLHRVLLGLERNVAACCAMLSALFAGAVFAAPPRPTGPLLSRAVRLSAAGQGILVAAYNSLGWSREVAVRVPVSTDATCAWEVTGEGGGGSVIGCWLPVVRFCCWLRPAAQRCFAA